MKISRIFKGKIETIEMDTKIITEVEIKVGIETEIEMNI